MPLYTPLFQYARSNGLGKAVGGKNNRVHNAREAAVARAKEGWLECNEVGCHKSVAPTRRKNGRYSCGKPNCAKNAKRRPV